MAFPTNRILILGLFVHDTIINLNSVGKLNKVKEPTAISVGGPPLYMGFAMNLLGKFYPKIGYSKIYSFIDKNLADKLKLLDYFPQEVLTLVNCEKSPRFELTYLNGLKEREIKLRNAPASYDINRFNIKLNSQSVVVVSSVFQEFNDPIFFEFLRKNCSFIALDPQGFFRKKTDESQIRYTQWFDKRILKQIDCLKLSRNEANFLGLGDNPVRIIEELMKLGIELVIITDGKFGSYLGRRIGDKSKPDINKIPAYNTGYSTNETGAGDTFFYTFLTFLIAFSDEKESIAYASSISSILVEKRFSLGEYNFKEIEKRKDFVLSNIQQAGNP
ncbi:MAG: PfkB family carbohydrate kinase [Candidatus Hodarchaeales archaeon]|jgi:hypothetical protein